MLERAVEKASVGILPFGVLDWRCDSVAKRFLLGYVAVVLLLLEFWTNTECRLTQAESIGRNLVDYISRNHDG